MCEGPREYDLNFAAANELHVQSERAKRVLVRLAAHLAATDPRRREDLRDLVERKHVLRAARLIFRPAAVLPVPASQSVFISYSHPDSDFVGEFCSKLDGAGITHFMADRDIHGASDWTEDIWDAIRGCRVFVSILTTQFMRRRWFYLEGGAACASRKIVLPVLRHVRRRDVKPPFDRFQSMTVQTSVQLGKLVERLRALCQKP